jgi:glucose/arabinose dehydrogenase
MKRSTIVVALLVPVILVLTAVAAAQTSSERPQDRAARQAFHYQLVEIASGLTRPLYVTHAGDGSSRLFIVQQGGRILIYQDGTVLDTPFLDISGLVSPEALGGGYSERGLLGLAFDPNYAQNGRFYVNYTDRNGDTILARYAVSPGDPDRADPDSAVQLLYVQQPYANHNGGHLAFGPDGYLYMALGDGGSGGDPQGNGQNLGTLLGKIIRLDVSGDGYAIPDDNPFVGDSEARPEIWAWGVRNPWRFSFDRATGDLYIGEVGQNQWEEIDFQPAASAGGENYGWNILEGTHSFSGAADPGNLVMPILEYSHSNGCSVTGGYVYRGQDIPGMQGYYLYGDWCSGTIWAARQNDAGEWQTEVSLESGLSISSFGEDEAGELYLVDYEGSLLRFQAQ